MNNNQHNAGHYWTHLGGNYYLLTNYDNAQPYTIMERTQPGHMQQVARWYYYKRCAVRAYERHTTADYNRGIVA